MIEQKIMKRQLAEKAALLQDNFVNTYGEKFFIPEATPILWLGRPVENTTLTVGMNPSPRDFLDQHGKLLNGEKRRFAAKSSQETMQSWFQKKKNYDEMFLRLEGYFERETVNTSWFGKKGGGKLEGFMNAWERSFYQSKDRLIHMDYLPIATKKAVGKLKIKAEMLYHSEVQALFAARVNYLQPERIIFLGKEFEFIITDKEDTWNSINHFPSAKFRFGTFQHIPAVILSFKPAEQFLGLGGKEDFLGQNHGTYGKKKVLKEISSVISREMDSFMKK